MMMEVVVVVVSGIGHIVSVDDVGVGDELRVGRGDHVGRADVVVARADQVVGRVGRVRV